jgi:hypothetical protein
MVERAHIHEGVSVSQVKLEACFQKHAVKVGQKSDFNHCDVHEFYCVDYHGETEIHLESYFE